MKQNVLIILPDWEERSIDGFLRNVNNKKIDKAFILIFKDGLHPRETEVNINKIELECISREIEFSRIELSNGHSIDNWLRIEDFVKILDIESQSIVLDISTMPREIIWSLLYNFKKQGFSMITYLYHKPKSYDDNWLSKEADTPRLLFKHSGVIDLQKNTCLVIIPGFDQERVNQLITYFEPRHLVIALQKGNQFDNDIRNNPKNYIIEQQKQFIEIDGYSSDNGYSELKSKISELLKRYNVVITSLGPKLTALSLYHLNIDFPDVALAYVPCKQFNLNYSYGIGDTIEGVFNFNN